MSRQELYDVIQALASKKKRERLVALETLLVLLRRDDVVNLLNQKPNKNSISWNTLFIRVHNAVLMDVEKAETKNITIVDKHLQTVHNVISDISQKSLYGEIPLLDCDTVVCSILSIFESNFRMKFLGSIYTDLLLKYILGHRKFWGEIKLEHWIEMKNLCKMCFQNPPSETQSVIYLNALSDIIRLSCKNLMISQNFLDIFCFVKNIFTSNKGFLCGYGSSLLRLVNILCLQLATEFRCRVCSFMEEIFDFVLSFYDKKQNNRNPLIYHYLITYLNVHNPNGVSGSDESFYAHDEEKWRKQIMSMYSLTQEATKELLKNPEKTEFEVGFMDLIVDINYLVFVCGLHRSENCSGIPEDEEYSESPSCSNKRKLAVELPPLWNTNRSSGGQTKKAKRSDDFRQFLEGLLSPDAWFWLIFLELLLQKYPQILITHFKEIIEVLSKLLHDCLDSKISQDVCRCLSIIISKEKYYAKQITEHEGRYLNGLWNKIGNEVIRLFKIDNSVEYHKLMRSLIISSKFLNPAPLINLYYKEKFGTSIDNFLTLFAICQNCDLPESLTGFEFNENEDYNHVRLFFLKWLFRDRIRYPTKELSKILVTLISTKSEEENYVPSASATETLIVSKNISDFCKLITNTYGTVSMKNLKFVENVKVIETTVTPKIDVRMQSELFSCLENRFDGLIYQLFDDDKPTSENIDTIRDSLHHCEFLLHLYSHLINLGVKFENQDIILDKLKMLLFLTTNKSYLILQNKYFGLVEYFTLYSGTYHIDLCKVIRENDCLHQGFLQHLFDIFKEGFVKNSITCKGKKDEFKTDNNGDIKVNSAFSNLITNPRSILHIGSLSEEEKKTVEIVEVLCHFIIVPGCLERTRFQKVLELKLFEELTRENVVNLDSDFHLQIVLRVAFNFSKFDGIDSDALQNNLKMILIVFESAKYDSEVAVVILQIMKDLIYSISRTYNNDCESMFMLLINGFRKLILDKKKFGISVITKFIEFLTGMVKSDWNETSLFYKKKNEIYEFFRDIILFLKHPYYEVRLFVAQLIGSLFSVPENDEVIVARQRGMINLLQSTLMGDKHIVEQNNSTSLVLPYHRDVGVAVSIISWATIVCLSNYWRRSALFYLIEMAYIRKFNKDKVCGAISLICRELNVKSGEKFISTHLPYLINKWAEASYEIDDFPYYILGCHSLGEFLREYSKIFLPILLWNGSIQCAGKLSTEMNISLKQLVKECYPELISIILPSLSENIDSRTVMKANKLKRLLDKELGVDSSGLIATHMDEIIFRIFCYIEDNNYLSGLCQIQACLIEESTSARFTVPQIAEILGSAPQAEGRTFLGEIVLESPHVVQKVLILLSNEVENACISDDKVLSFCKYVAFVEILSNTTRQPAFRNIITFIMRDVIWTLVSFVRCYKSVKITGMALKCLKILLKNYITEFGDVICDFLSIITMLCKPLVLKGYEEALVIIKFLICENFGKLQSAVVTLDPFPAETIFEEINSVLEKNKRKWANISEFIRHFLSVASKERCALEGLKCLRATLTSRKEELKMLCDELHNSRGFSEDCRKSLLHQLIRTLIELTSDKNVSVRLEAARCLGEVGPLDLTTLDLKPGTRYVGEKPNESPIFRLLKFCINHLSDLIINENLEIKMASSDLIYIILESQDGNEILEEEEPKIKSYFLPFCSKAKKNLIIKNNSVKLKNNMNEPGLWIPKNHEEWIKSLVKQLLKSFTDSNGLIEAMLNLVEIYWQFAENIFPFILDVVLSFRDPIRTEIITENLSAFFNEYFDLVKKAQPQLNFKSLQCMVNAVDYLRIQRIYEGTYEEFDLKINYLQVADAARYCSAFFTSTLYVELWFNEKKKLDANLTIDKVCELYPEEGFTLTNILRECYSKIGILDGVQGCGYMHLLDFSTESRHFEYLNKWNISMVYHDTELSQGCPHSERLLMNSLQQCGLFYSLSKLIQCSNNIKELKDFEYKCATTLSDWNLIQHKWSNDNTNDSYEKGRYFALKAYHDDDESTFFSEIRKARRCTINKLSSSSVESVENLYQFLSELRCLKELEDFGLIVTPNSTVNDVETMFKRWCLQDTIKYSDFKFIEDILTQRIILLREEMKRNKNPALAKILNAMLCKVYYKLVKTARKEKRYGIAIRHLNSLSRLENLPDSFSGKIKIEKSFLEWEIGDPEAGKFLLCHYLKRDEIRGELKGKALKIYGDWMASTNSENSMFIIEQYYLKSIEMTQRSKDRMNSYASLAKFADSNYEQVKEYLSSPLYEIKKNIIHRQQDIASELRQEIDWNQDREKKIACRLVERQSVIDENEIKNSENEKNLFLNLAIQYYLLSLREGEKYDLLVFRLISLWFSNLDNDNVISRLKEYLHEIPTHKFLCLLPQIAPRMAEVGLVSSLVERTLLDHPHHILPILFALANSFEDAKYGGIKQISCSQRALVARAILEKFQKNQKVKQLITEMGQFCDAMIELANTSPAKGECGSRAKAGMVVTIPSHLKIIRLKNLSYVPVPSLTIPYQKSCNYSNIIGIKCIEQQYQLVGGINVPKKVTCVGLDGVSRPLLVKGKDDLRQDAVMQQVFTIMNSLLYRDSDASRKKLVIRTYKVVPLSHRSGIIEWCENTQPLSLYLIGRDAMSGAHRKFYPDDITALECRARLRKVFGTADVTNDSKLRVFLNICSQFRPVFRHFFFENFPEPGVWFERRLAYTHSVATSSMIGYILGIGDRHVQNILIDNATAEVIHIDLGIAFEQGKTLPTPETVPFRLTRDIVDGMGISGVEGVFRSSCIKTMKILRENQHAILTLLEVLLYDPLYAWTITAEKAFIVQGHEGTESSSEKNSSVIEINRMAERALIRLKQKLQGTETGGVATNVEGQVNYLIQQARDPNNLCRLFHGWQAYL